VFREVFGVGYMTQPNGKTGDRVPHTAPAVQSELAAILASPGFVRSPRRSAFLRFVVEQALTGRAAELKETLIGIQVFGRPADYDPKSDPVVRTEAAKMRAALAEYYNGPGRAATFVIEVPKGGYAPVWRTTAPLSPNGLSKRRIAMILLIVGTAAAVWLTLDVMRNSAGDRQKPLEAVPFTSYLGVADCASFSPDGNQVAFTWNGEKQDNFDIYVRLIDAPTPRRLTTNPQADISPTFSPDGRSIAFVRVTNQRGQIFLMPAIGGPERLLGDFDFPVRPAPNSPLLAWLPDGKWLVTRGLYLISTETGEMRRLTSGSADYPIDFSPGVSPDGHTIAFSRCVGINLWEIYLLDLTGDLRPSGAARRLTSLGRTSHTPVWTPDGREIIFAASQHALLSLWKVDVSGPSKPQQFAFSSGPHNGYGDWWPVLSRQGDRLIFTRDVHDLNIWRASRLAAGQASVSRIIASSRDDLVGDFSPDGNRIVFASNRSGSPSIWVSDADGSNQMEVYSRPDGSAGSPRWSPDGKRIVYDSTDERLPSSEAGIYTIGATGGKPARVTSGSGILASWSRDGNSIYFCSTRSGREEVWKAPASGGDAVQITRNGGFVTFESYDVKFLYFTKQGQGVFKMSVGGGEETRLLPAVVGDRDFLPVKEGIYFIPVRDREPNFQVKFLSFATGGIESIAVLPGQASLGLSISPDQRSILYSQMDARGADLMMVLNRSGHW